MNFAMEIKQTINVVVLAYPGCFIGDVIKLLEALQALHDLHCAGGSGQNPLVTHIYSLDGKDLSSPSMPLFTIKTQSISDPLPQPLDTLIIAHGTEDSVRHLYRPVLEWLQRTQPNARRVVALGAGVFWLAAAGMLRSRTVTTHSSLIDRLRLYHSELDVRSSSSLQIDGPFYTANERISSSDLAKLLLRDQRSNAVQRRLLPAEQSVSLARGATFQLCSWWLEKMDADLNMQTSARQMNISERHLRRQVKEETGFTPSMLLMLLRLEMARQALLDSDLPVDKVARRGGLRDGQQLARLFRKYLGQSPLQYRHGGLPGSKLHEDYHRLFGIEQPLGWLQQMVHEARAS